MSANTPPRKKVVVTGSKKPAVAPSRAQRPDSSTGGETLLYGRSHYLLMGAGVIVIILGLALMSGGSMPDPDTWDESLIYSGRRTILAPMVILTGLAIEIFAIFKRS